MARAKRGELWRALAWALAAGGLGLFLLLDTASSPPDVLGPLPSPAPEQPRGRGAPHGGPPPARRPAPSPPPAWSAPPAEVRSALGGPALDREEARARARVAIARALRRPVVTHVHDDEVAPTCVHLAPEDGAELADVDPIRAAARLVREALGALTPGLEVVAVLGAAPARGRALVATRAQTLEGGTTFVDFAPIVDGRPVVLAAGGDPRDAVVRVALRRAPRGWAPLDLVGRAPPGVPEGSVAPEVEAAARGGRLVVAEGDEGGARLAFDLRVEVADPALGWTAERRLVDATTGRLLAARRLAACGRLEALVHPQDPVSTPARAPRPLPRLRLLGGTTDGDGRHSLPGPVSLAEGLSSAWVRTLPLKPGAAGFAGPVPVAAPERAFAWTGPADAVLLDPPVDPVPSEVAAFVHAQAFVDWARARFHPLRAWSRVPGGVPAGDRRHAVEVDWAGPVAVFLPGPFLLGGEAYDGRILLGVAGTADTGRAAPLPLAQVDQLVRHELVHALVMGLADLSAQAYDEALADYLACAFDGRGRWCEVVGPRFFRDLTGATGRLRYPDDCAASGFEIHRVGSVVGQALWQARLAAEGRAPGAGAAAIDRAALLAVLRLPPYAPVEAVREAVVLAHGDADGGAFADLLDRAFADHGLGPAPAPRPAPPGRAVRAVLAASLAPPAPGSPTASPGSLVTLFGDALATTAAAAPPGGPLPELLAGTSVELVDAAGARRACALVWVGPNQVNLVVPEASALGPAGLVVTTARGDVARGPLLLGPVAPGLFTRDGSGSGLAATTALRVRADGVREPLPDGPLDLGGPGDVVHLSLWGTGLRGAARVAVTIGGLDAPVTFAGAHPSLPGLDQVNVVLPRALVGAGAVEVALVADGQRARPVSIATR